MTLRPTMNEQSMSPETCIEPASASLCASSKAERANRVCRCRNGESVRSKNSSVDSRPLYLQQVGFWSRTLAVRKYFDYFAGRYEGLALLSALDATHVNRA